MNKYLTIKAETKVAETINEKDILLKLIEYGASTVKHEDNTLTIQCSEKDLNNIKGFLETNKIDFNITKVRIFDTTLISSGIGSDPDNCVEVTLVPAPRLTRLKLLDIIFTKELKKNMKQNDEDFIGIYPPIVRNILKNGGITDAIFTIKFMNLETDLDEAVRIASIKALQESKGVKEI